MTDVGTCATRGHRDGRHIATCGAPDPTTGEMAPDPDCTGCMPRMATDGYRVCVQCRDATIDALRTVPDGPADWTLAALWAALAEPSRTGGVAAAPSGESEAREPIPAARWMPRAGIEWVLNRWAIWLAGQGVTPPSRESVDASLAATIRWNESQAQAIRDHARDAIHAAATRTAILGAPPDSQWAQERPVPADEIAAIRENAVASVAPLMGEAARARESSATGEAWITALTGHLARHAGNILAGDSDTAALLVEQVTSAHREAAAHANRSRPSGVRVRCTCGDMINLTAAAAMSRADWTTQTAEDDAPAPTGSEAVAALLTACASVWVVCDGCHDGRWLATWLREQVIPDLPDRPLPLARIYDWLKQRGSTVKESWILDLASTGRIRRVEGPQPPPEPGTRRRGRPTEGRYWAVDILALIPVRHA